MTNQIVFYDDSAPARERALYAFLAEKERCPDVACQKGLRRAPEALC